MMVTRMRRIQGPIQSQPVQPSARDFTGSGLTWLTSVSISLSNRQREAAAPITYETWGPMYLSAADVRSAFRSQHEPVTCIVMADGHDYEVYESVEDIGSMIGDELKNRQRSRAVL